MVISPPRRKGPLRVTQAHVESARKREKKRYSNVVEKERGIGTLRKVPYLSIESAPIDIVKYEIQLIQLKKKKH